MKEKEINITSDNESEEKEQQVVLPAEPQPSYRDYIMNKLPTPRDISLVKNKVRGGIFNLNDKLKNGVNTLYDQMKAKRESDRAVSAS